MKFHPYAEIFPLIEGASLDELAADIKANGQQEKIWLLDGKILDGRNRFLACKKAGVAPQTRKYTGKDPLAFVISANIHRRHLSESQRAMAAARIATLNHGQRKADAPIGASLTQVDAAESMGVGRRTVQRARKVIEEGSKALQQAVSSGEITVSRAAAVVDLPKPEQLAAATKKPDKPQMPTEVNLDEKWVPEDDEDARIELMEKEYAASIDKVMEADDKLTAARDEIKRQAAEIAVLKLSRDGYMNERLEAIRLCKQLRRENDRLKKQAEKQAA
jgi:ParB-like chromosome segregation protein Spo0J